MGLGRFLKKTVAYTSMTTATITALPVLGAAGAITATGTAVATGIGALAALTDDD